MYTVRKYIGKPIFECLLNGDEIVYRPFYHVNQWIDLLAVQEETVDTIQCTFNLLLHLYTC